MNLKLGFIYQIRNIINDKKYIGSTTNIIKRWSSHKKQLKNRKHHCIALQNAYNKYGKDNFVFEKIEEINIISLNDLKNLEQRYLDFIRDNREQFYNTALIAERPDSQLNKKPIIQLDYTTLEKIKYWDSATDASIGTGIDANTIMIALKGRYTHAGGFRWQYVDECLNKKYEIKLSKNISYRKKINQLDFNFNLINIFSSIDEASKTLNISRSIISNCVSGKREQTHGFYFLNQDDVSNFIDKKKKIKHEKPILCCKICNFIVNNERALASHIQINHKMKTKKYTINYIFNGKNPKCMVCDIECEYIAFTFKKYCKKHCGGKSE